MVVHRQVLAQPGPELAARTWARLADGTPLITGAPRGEGWLVLVHTTANTTWSSLPLSGRVRRAAAAGRGARAAAPAARRSGLLAPLEVLDAGGHLASRARRRSRSPAGASPRPPASAEHPPGLYGPVEAGEDAARQALNLASAVPDLQALRPADLAGPGRATTRPPRRST